MQRKNLTKSVLGNMKTITEEYSVVDPKIFVMDTDSTFKTVSDPTLKMLQIRFRIRP
jgi:hypothetical protein